MGPEPVDEPAVPLTEFSETIVRMADEMNTLSTIRTWVLDLRQRTPDFPAIRQFQNVRYRHDQDDYSHEDPFGLAPTAPEPEIDQVDEQRSYAVGILAYGSLIDTPGPELEPRIVARPAVTTPFLVEFARSSESRGYGPTLIPVEKGGANVPAVILILSDEVTVDDATHMLYRREKHDYEPTVRYRVRERPGPNTIVIKSLQNFVGVETVLYTSIGANIPDLSAEVLAQLAIDSVSLPRSAEDGISYLIAAKRNGIVTPLSPGYEATILQRTDTEGLEAALTSLSKSGGAATPAATDEENVSSSADSDEQLPTW